MTAKKQLIDFILRFELGNIATSLTISMTIWTIFESFDSVVFTLLTLGVLLCNAYLMRRFSYTFDHYSRKLMLQWLNITMIVVLSLVLLIDVAWLYLFLYWCCALYFQIFYTSYNAISQMLSMKNKQIISATLEFSGKISNFCVAGLIWVLFEPLGKTPILMFSASIYVLVIWAISSFSEPFFQSNSTSASTFKKGFEGYFCQPIAWLVTLAMMPNIIVLLSNTINSVYFYQVLFETPNVLALLSMAFSIGSMIGAGLVFRLCNEKIVIHVGVMICLIMSWVLAIFPTTEFFILAMTVFGFVNSTSRVMFRLAIMNNISDIDAGSFYSLRGSLVSGIQFIALLSMNVAITVFSPAVSIWFFPAVFLALPVLWVMSENTSRCYNTETHLQRNK